MDLKKEVSQRADRFNDELERFLVRNEPHNLYDAARHLPLAGGKRLRPVLSMICCESVGGADTDVIPFAIGVELIHNFSLVHDDIMDKSTLRRNLETVHIKYGEPTAIIAGDLLFAKAFEALTLYPQGKPGFRKLYGHLLRSVIEVCDGQQFDMNFEDRHVVAEDEYISMIGMKTAALFRISCEGGVLAAGASDKVQKDFSVYGNALGLAFQIHDDFLDMSSTKETLGKDIGNDIRNGKKTMIAVHALSHAEGADKKVLKDIFGKASATEEEIQQVHAVFQDSGSIEYAKKKALEYSDTAIHVLDAVDESPAKNVLTGLASYAITREK